MSPSWFLIQFDTIIIGIAISFGIQSISTQYSPIGLINTISFFLVAINFYHGKLTHISDVEYQTYADNRSNQAELGDFVAHVITLGSFGFMPFFLHNINGYIICHIVLRLSDMILVLIVYTTVKGASIGEKKIIQIKKTQKDWFIIDLIIALCIAILYFFLKSGYSIELFASIAILALGICDITTDYILHRKYYFGEKGRPKKDEKEKK